MTRRMADAQWHRLGNGLRFLALVATVSCSRGATANGEPTVQQLPVDSLTLAPGDEAQLAGLRVAFLGVENDSRCATDVVCVWQGNAEVRITLGIAPSPDSTYVLNTSEGLPSVALGGYRVTLLALEPAPLSTVRIAPSAYRASFRVEEIAKVRT
jgi:hypothetical protein